MDDFVRQILTLGGIGAAIQAGKEARNYTPEGKINWIQLGGRCVVSAGLAVSAMGAVALVPSLPFAAQVGIAAGFVVVGQVVLEKIVDKYTSKKE